VLNQIWAIRDRVLRRLNGKLSLVVLLHHREAPLGFHTFERFFNPKWHTIIVVEEDMEDQYQIKQLASAASSPAIHVALLNVNDMTATTLQTPPFPSTKCGTSRYLFMLMTPKSATLKNFRHCPISSPSISSLTT